MGDFLLICSLIYVFAGTVLGIRAVDTEREHELLDKVIIILVSMFAWLPILILAIYELRREER